MDEILSEDNRLSFGIPKREEKQFHERRFTC